MSPFAAIASQMRLSASTSSRCCVASENALARYVSMSSRRLASPKVSRKNVDAARESAAASLGVATRRRICLSTGEAALDDIAWGAFILEMLRRHEEEGQRKEQIHRKEQHALEPRRFAILRDRVDDERRAGDRDQFDRIVKHEIHRTADQIREDHEQRRDEQADLNRRSDRDSH